MKQGSDLKQSTQGEEMTEEDFFNLHSYSRESLLGLIDYEPQEQIAIRGPAGVGKSETLRILKTRLENKGYEFVSAGDFQRVQANSLNMLLEEYQEKVLPFDPTFDRKCDSYLYQKCRTVKKIVESRFGHCCVLPGALTVLLDCSLEERGRRNHPLLLKKYPHLTVGGAIEKLRIRDAGDNERLSKRYPNCIWSPDDFDEIISTEHNSAERVADLILARFENHLAGIAV